MGILDNLGLGGIGGLIQDSNPFQNPQAMAGISMPYAPMYIERCKHYNCPMCKEENFRLVIVQKKKDWEIARKKEDYEKRCKEYMKRFKKG